MEEKETPVGASVRAQACKITEVFHKSPTQQRFSLFFFSFIIKLTPLYCRWRTRSRASAPCPAVSVFWVVEICVFYPDCGCMPNWCSGFVDVAPEMNSLWLLDVRCGWASITSITSITSLCSDHHVVGRHDCRARCAHVPRDIGGGANGRMKGDLEDVELK